MGSFIFLYGMSCLMTKKSIEDLYFEFIAGDSSSFATLLPRPTIWVQNHVISPFLLFTVTISRAISNSFCCIELRGFNPNRYRSTVALANPLAIVYNVTLKKFVVHHAVVHSKTRSSAVRRNEPLDTCL